VRKAQIPNRLIVVIPLDEQIALFCDAFERRRYRRELLFESQCHGFIQPNAMLQPRAFRTSDASIC
jgi:hypothetical protein